jgi:hypothetical protein
MLLKELNYLTLDKNNVYRLEPYHDKIIINENYDSIKILDLSLNIIKTISLIPNLQINSIYKQSNGNAIIIHDFDHEQLIFVDLKTEKTILINIKIFIAEPFYPYHYYWQENTLIFALEKKCSFYRLNLISLSLEQIASKTVQLIAPSFFDFCYICNLYCRKYRTVIIDSDKESCIFFKNRNLIGFYKHKNKVLILSKHKFTLSEKAYCYKDNLIFFDLANKTILFKKDKYLFDIEKSYECLDVNLLNNNNIIVLERNKDNHRLSLIKIYEIED